MLIKTLPVGMLETNCYVVTDEESRKCAIIDPGAESNTILDYIEGNRLEPVYIFLTHGHFDHFMALRAVMAATQAPVYIHVNDVGRRAEYRIDGNRILNFYAEGDSFMIGGLEMTVLETPGHSPGSVTLKCESVLFTGDTLFKDECGRTDLGGDERVLLQSLKRLSDLEGDYEVYPGHLESTTLSRERSFNYAMHQANSL